MRRLLVLQMLKTFLEPRVCIYITSLLEVIILSHQVLGIKKKNKQREQPEQIVSNCQCQTGNRQTDFGRIRGFLVTIYLIIYNKSTMQSRLHVSQSTTGSKSLCCLLFLKLCAQVLTSDAHVVTPCPSDKIETNLELFSVIKFFISRCQGKLSK